MSDQTDPTDANIYWGVVRNQSNRIGYFELEEIGNGKWVAVLEDVEFNFRSNATHYLDALADAIAKYRQANPIRT